MTRAALLALIGLVGGGCGFDAEIVLRLQTDIGTDRQASVELLVATPAEADPVSEGCVCVADAGCPDGVRRQPLPFTASLRPGRQGTAPFRIYARGYADGACGAPPIVEAKAKVVFTRGTSRQLTMVLSAACAGVVCGPTQTCDPTQTPPQCVDDSTELPPVDPTLDFAMPEGDAAMPVDLATPPPVDMATLPQRIDIAGAGVTAFAVTGLGSEFRVSWTDPGMNAASSGNLHIARVAVDGSVTPVDTLTAPGGFDPLDQTCAAATGAEQIFVTGLGSTTDGMSQLWGEVVGGSVTTPPMSFATAIDRPAFLRCHAAGGRELLAWATSASGTMHSAVSAQIRYPGGMPPTTSPAFDTTDGTSIGNVAVATRGPMGPVIGESFLAYTYKKPGGGGAVTLTYTTIDDTLKNLSANSINTGGVAVAVTYGPQGAALARTDTTTSSSLMVGLRGGTEHVVAGVGTINTDGLALVPSGSDLLVTWVDGGNLYVTKIGGDGLPGPTTNNVPVSTTAIRVAAATNVDGVSLVVWQEVITNSAGADTTVVVGRLVAPTP